MRKTQTTYAGLIVVTALLLCGFGCPSGTKKLATASDAIAHALANADAAANQAVTSGVISAADRDLFHSQLVRVSQAGLVLNSGIRANESATTLSTKVNAFLDAFNMLNSSGLAGIKDPNTKISISTILTGAEASVAIIAAAVGR